MKGYFCALSVLRAVPPTLNVLLAVKQQRINFILNEIMVQKTYFKTKDYCKVKFSFTPENAETVEILGLNSDWQNSVIMSKKKNGSFTADVNLPRDSKHAFKYRVNESEWLNEPEADAQEPNEFGGTNSVITL